MQNVTYGGTERIKSSPVENHLRYFDIHNNTKISFWPIYLNMITWAVFVSHKHDFLLLQGAFLSSNCAPPFYLILRHSSLTIFPYILHFGGKWKIFINFNLNIVCISLVIFAYLTYLDQSYSYQNKKLQFLYLWFSFQSN